jgi:uncharacterized membrane protein YphA (DoxX/SURF4 family)
MDLEQASVAIRLVVGGLFIAAGGLKIRAGSDRVMRSIGAYKILSARWASIAGRWLGPAELTVGIALVAGLLTLPASLVGIALLTIFNFGIGIALLRGQRNECGCGVGVAAISRRLLARNFVLIGLLLVSAIQPGL